MVELVQAKSKGSALEALAIGQVDNMHLPEMFKTACLVHTTGRFLRLEIVC